MRHLGCSFCRHDTEVLVITFGACNNVKHSRLKFLFMGLKSFKV